MKSLSGTGLMIAGLLAIGPALGARAQGSIDLDNTLASGRVTTVLSGEEEYYAGVYGLEVWVGNFYMAVPDGINGQISWIAYARLTQGGFFRAATFTNQDNSLTPGVINLGELDIRGVAPGASNAVVALVMWDGEASLGWPWFTLPFGIVAFMNPTADYTAVPKPAAPPLTGWTSNLRIDLPDQLEYDYSVSDGVVILKFSYDAGPSLRVPKWLGGLQVYGIDSGAYSGHSTTRTVTIPNGIGWIAAGAFSNCVNLTDVFCLGDAPVVNSAAFTGDTNAIVHYYQGTAGWSNTFGGLPAVAMPWKATLQAPGVRNNQFSFDITGVANIPIMVEASTDLTSGAWTPLQAGTLTGGLRHFVDSDWSNHPARFYRIRLP